MLLPHGTLIALVDGERFELYRNSGNEAHPELAAIDTPKLDEQNKGSGNRHYSSAGNPQASLLNEDAHAAAVTEWLNGQVLAHKLEALVVIAAPRTLGEMRKHYHKQLEATLLGELSKDLVGRSGPEIIDALKA
jgi:protein required for attachment to host cells